MNKMHVGCGPIYLEGYLNIDSGDFKTDINGNILHIEFPESSFDVIYSCHFFEHLAYPHDAVKCLSLFHKWLKPGGIMRMAVPDLELAAKAYAKGESLSFLYRREFKGFYYLDTPCERLNFFVKAWQHAMCYDFDLMSKLLMNAGFSSVLKCSANESRIPDFNHDRFISESLYIETTK